MATHNLLLLPGDGIGPEVMAQVKRLIDFFNKKGPDRFTTEEGLVGGSCYDAHKVAITDGGVYFGEPKTITDLGNGQKRAIDTQVYDTYEIERIGRVAFELARKRRNKVTSMEKRNVMKTGVLWNEVITALHAREFKDVELEHQLADSGGMQLVRNPKQFDVIVTDNLFGDMLSDIAAMLTGSLGMLASASLGEADAKTKKRKALYEPVHGSAPDIAGKGIANPIAMIASFGMALRYSFDMGKQADMIDKAIAATLDKGLRTADIKSEGTKVVSTSEMGDAILAELEAM
jgi:3-isopropylmalate dehydrogenase